jgi:hypothetical protein
MKKFLMLGISAPPAGIYLSGRVAVGLMEALPITNNPSDQNGGFL